MEVKKIPISQIKPYWRNPRKISDRAVKAVAESIKRYGFNQPIVVNKNNVIIVGHTRYKALIELGYEEADCVIADLSPKKAKEYRLIDNKTNEFAAWDFEALTVELRELEIEDMKPFFEDVESLIKTSVGINEAEISDEDIGYQLRDETDRYKEKSNKIQEGYVEVICPECGHTFYVDKEEIANRL